MSTNTPSPEAQSLADGVTPRAFWRGLAGVTGLALVLGLLRLGHNDVWYDEAATFHFARPRAEGFFSFLMRWDTHGPLYYGFMRLWVAVFGEGAVSGRVPSALCAAGAVYVVGRLGARAFGRAVGLLAALLLATSPLHVFYAQEVRFYSFVELAVATNVLCFLALIDDRLRPGGDESARARPEWAAVAGFAATGAAYLLTFYLSATVLVAEAVCVTILWRSIDRQRVVIAFAGVALGFAPWLHGFLYQLRHTSGLIDWIPDVGTWGFLAKLFEAYVRGTAAKGWWPQVALAPVFLGCLLAGAAIGLRRSRRNALTTLLWLTVPLLLVLAVSHWKRLYVTRYLLMVMPAFFLLVAAGAWRAPMRWQRLALAAAMVTALAIGNIPHYFGLKTSERWGDAMSFLRRNLQATDLVAAAPLNDVVTLDHYLPDHPLKAGVNFPVDVLGRVPRGGRVWLLTHRARERDFPRLIGEYLLTLGTRDFGPLKLTWFAVPR
jgi:4-amino-4-deoxy-L-arabinose transferase-like glycosyltransferase